MDMVKPMGKYGHEDIYKGCGFREEIEKDIRANLDKFKDPVVLGELVYRLLEERENTNRILKTLLQRIEALEKAIEQGARHPPTTEALQQPVLSEVEEAIVAFVKKKGRVTAEDVRKEFNYKGRNAASARLNRLFELGVLSKRQSGRKVFFYLN